MEKGRVSLGLVGFLVALLLAGGAAAYLLSVKKEVERTTTPVPVAAPDFFPPETLLLVAVHRIDADWAGVDAWWKRIEPTASWSAFHDWFEGSRKGGTLPHGVGEAMDRFESAMSQAEARFGSRPTTKDFFETYGRYAAFALVPGAGSGPPRLLAVVKLPGEGVGTALQGRLGGLKEIRRNDPPSLHGYPVFTEDREKGQRVFYGIGGGYLFLSDDPAPLDGALARLAEHAAGLAPGKTLAPSLSDDPVFRRGVPGSWEDLRFAMFVRKDQQFARWDPSLEGVDGFLRHAFVLAPGDPALCLSASGPPGSAYVLHASFAAGSRGGKPWESLLPGGLCLAQIGRGETEARKRAAFQTGLDRLRGKPLWKEIDALSRDTPRLQRILEETLGKEAIPPQATLARLPKDVELLGAVADALLEAAWFTPEAEYAFGQKVFRGAHTTVQTVVALDADPVMLFLAASSLDHLADVAKGWVVREPGPGVLVWRLDLVKAREEIGKEMPPDSREPLDSVLDSYSPAIVAAGGCLYLVLGEDMRKEVVDLASGKPVPTLAADPIFREAMAAVEPGFDALNFQRPSQSARAGLEGIRGMALKAVQGPEPGGNGEVLDAAFTALDEALSWGESMKAVVTASYADASKPSVDVVLLDPAKEKAGPPLGMDPSALRAPGILPEGTFLLAEGHVQVRPAVERLTAAFQKALPGGRERWEKFRADLPGNAAKIEESLDRLLVDVKGETGVALVVPPVAKRKPEEIRLQDLVDRAPGIVLFAAYADPDRAFETAASDLEDLDRALQDPTPFDARRRDFDRRRGPRPVGTRVDRVTLGEGNPAVMFRVFWPEGPRGNLVTLSLGVVRRGDMLLFSTSGPVLERMGSAAPGGPGTFAARMKTALPEGFLPAEVTAEWVLREDGFAECLGLYFDPLVPMGAGLTLQGYGGEPPPERVQAHMEGWRKALDLLEDAMRTSGWSAGGTVREGDRLRTVNRRTPGR